MTCSKPRVGLACFMAAVMAAGVSCGGPEAEAPDPFEPSKALYTQFSGARAQAWAQQIVEFGPRPAGSAALEKTRQFFESELKKLGWETERQTFADRTPRGPQTFVNVRARFPGGETWERPVTTVVGSHYDTKFFASIEFVGANDGASGNALMLEMARVLAQEPKLARRVELVFFDGEEAWENYTLTDGLHGSRFYAHWLRKLPAERRPRSGVIFDMVGDPDLRIGIPPNTSQRLTKLALQAAEAAGTRKFFGQHPTEILDDHVPLAQAGLEVVNFIDLDFPAWHTAADTMDKVSPRSLEIAGQTGLLLLEKFLLRPPAGS